LGALQRGAEHREPVRVLQVRVRLDGRDHHPDELLRADVIRERQRELLLHLADIGDDRGLGGGSDFGDGGVHAALLSGSGKVTGSATSLSQGGKLWSAGSSAGSTIAQGVSKPNRSTNVL